MKKNLHFKLENVNVLIKSKQQHGTESGKTKNRITI